MMSFLAYLKEVILAGLSLSLTHICKYVTILVMYIYFHYLETVELSTRHILDDVSQDQTLVQ